MRAICDQTAVTKRNATKRFGKVDFADLGLREPFRAMRWCYRIGGSPVLLDPPHVVLMLKPAQKDGKRAIAMETSQHRYVVEK